MDTRGRDDISEVAVEESAPDTEVASAAESESAPDNAPAADSGDETSPARPARRGWRPTRGDWAAIGVTFGAHAALLIVAYYSSWIQGGNHTPSKLYGSFQFWDALRYVNYAQHGIFSGASTPNDAAFFPGYPLLLAFVHLFVRNWLASVLLLSLVAGGATAVLLNRIAGSTKAGLFLFTAPAAVFLAVGYSEPIFLAFAVGAWYAAQRGEWSAVPLLAGLAGFTRIDGLALIPALVVFGLVRPGNTTRLRAASASAAALFGPFLYMLYLRLVTGSWNAWQQASRAGWNLKIDWPWVSLRDSYRNAYENHWDPAFYPWSWSFELELVCSIAAIALVIVLLVRREWPEACYSALILASIICVNYQMGADRGLLVCFPGYVLLARLSERRPWIGQAYVWVSAPVALLLTGLYTTGNWAN
ncbi:mannosyltransferase family protein [Actinospica robiniae]|uniref:mannosyltransferase family protein n=1 Tax=Actinospica robiniae TaxID=304901 RepID=UPI0004144124|nr:mannosyltransferase family protein [Actinospica robiniae]